jgi:hypothetical protein
MSGQFWRMTLDSKENIVLVSTLLGIRKVMTFSAFTGAVIRGSILVEGGI